MGQDRFDGTLVREGAAIGPVPWHAVRRLVPASPDPTLCSTLEQEHVAMTHE